MGSWSSWTSAKYVHVNSFGSSSRFYLDVLYRHKRTGNTVDYEIHLDVYYTNTASGGGSGTYGYPIGTKINFNNGGNSGYTKVTGGGTWSCSGGGRTNIGYGSYSFSITNTTGSGTVPCKAYVNNMSTEGFDNPGWHSCSLSIPVMDNFTVSYNANGGTNPPASQTKEPNVDLTLTTAIPSKASTIGTTRTVTFDGNGGNLSEIEGLSNNSIEYSFKYWTPNADGSGTKYGVGYTTTYTTDANITLYANWEPNPMPYNPVTLPASGFKAGGYRLLGYSVDSEAATQDTGLDPGASYVPGADIILYAVWQREGTVLKLAKEVYELVWPIGSVYMSRFNVNPTNYFGGTWEAYSPEPFDGVYMWRRTG